MKTYGDIATSAKEILPNFAQAIAGIPYEQKGVLYSEMLFMMSCLQERPSRILESGRARGQSTLLLARALPETTIVSVEYNPESPDVPVAAARLEGEKNVELLFGDALVLLPKLLLHGDVVIIDGPKMFRAIRFALQLLATGKVTYIFLHDLGLETPERKFLDRFMPECRFSDERTIASVTHVVDTGALASIPPHQRFGGLKGDFGYGFSLGCIPHLRGRSYRFLWIIASAYDAFGRIRRKLGRRS